MSVSQFKVFRDIAQSHSVSRAAEMNGISQSAASQHLRTLERRLGVELLDRRTRPIRLTAAGKIYYEASRDIVRRYERMQAELQALRVELVGAVRVVSIYSIGLYEMARIKEAFEELNPEAHIHLEYMRPEKVYEAVQQDLADFGLVSYPSPSKDLRSLDWRLERMVLVCRPDDPLARRASIRPAELSGREFISFDPDLSIRKALDRFFRVHGVQRSVALEFDNIEMIKEAVSVGAGVSILPERTVRQEVAEGRLVTRRIEADGLVRPVGVILHRKKKLSRTGARFLQFLKDRPADAG